MQVNATLLYREPRRVFAAADRGETVTLTREGRTYELKLKRKARGLYGSMKGSVLAEKGEGSRRGRPPESIWDDVRPLNQKG